MKDSSSIPRARHRGSHRAVTQQVSANPPIAHVLVEHNYAIARAHFLLLALYDCSGGVSMRSVCCSCRQRFVAPDDAQLYQVYLDHIREAHPDNQLTELQLHTVLLYSAHDLDVSDEQAALAKEDSTN
jgi:hypothetical protein